MIVLLFLATVSAQALELSHHEKDDEISKGIVISNKTENPFALAHRHLGGLDVDGGCICFGLVSAAAVCVGAGIVIAILSIPTIPLKVCFAGGLCALAACGYYAANQHATKKEEARARKQALEERYTSLHEDESRLKREIQFEQQNQRSWISPKKPTPLEVAKTHELMSVQAEMQQIHTEYASNFPRNLEVKQCPQSVKPAEQVVLHFGDKMKIDATFAGGIKQGKNLWLPQNQVIPVGGEAAFVFNTEEDKHRAEGHTLTKIVPTGDIDMKLEEKLKKLMSYSSGGVDEFEFIDGCENSGKPLRRRFL